MPEESVVEHVLNYGDWDDVQKMIRILGKGRVAEIFREHAFRPRNNYNPMTRNYFDLYFDAHIPMPNIKKHWSVDRSAFKGDPNAVTVWELENRINFGIGKATIPHTVLKVHWDRLDIDPWKRKALALALE